MRSRFNWQAVGLAVAIVLLCAGPAIADTVEERLQAVLSKIEAMVTKLALDDSLDTQETDALRTDLAQVYRELQALKSEVVTPAPPTPADPVSATEQAEAVAEVVPAEPAPAGEPTAPQSEWRLYAKAKAQITPPDAKFTSWQPTASINFRWGEYGEVILDVANEGYLASWTIGDAYHGNVNIDSQTGADGNITVQIKDELGEREFKVQNGGLGPLLFRQLSETAAVPDSPQPEPVHTVAPAAQPAPELAGVWYRTYREQVASGSLAGSEALEWFIGQYESGEYANAELAKLGECLHGLGGQAHESLGRLQYTNDSQPRSIDIPDPRVNPVSFIQIANKIYGLNASGEQYTVELV
jgi:hypothetical protein